MNIENIKAGDRIFYAGAFYEVAEIKEFPHGKMVGIFDDPKSNHIDFIKPESIREVVNCYSCPGCGCTVCSGMGVLVL